MGSGEAGDYSAPCGSYIRSPKESRQREGPDRRRGQAEEGTRQRVEPGRGRGRVTSAAVTELYK